MSTALRENICDFAYTDLKIRRTDNQNYYVTFTVENTGSVAGREIAQVYVKNPETEIILDSGAFSVYQDSEFRVIGGEYEIQAGASLQDIRLSQNIRVEGTALKSPLTKHTPIPLSEEDFGAVYTYPRTHFSHAKPGKFTTKNSLRQMQPYSVLARRWSYIGKIAARLLYFPKSLKDPEVRMMMERVLERNIDGVCNQSGGMIKHSTIQKIVDSATKNER